MVHRTEEEAPAVESHANSGVYRTVTTRVVASLGRDLRAASERVAAFRGGLERRVEPDGDDDDLARRALQEIESAHEELRVAEEELLAQADELIATRAEIEHERSIYADLFEAAPDAYLVTDERGVVLQANRRAAELLNLDQALLVGKPLFSLVAHGDRGAFFNILEALGDAVFRAELRFRPRKEQDDVWISLSAQRGVRDESERCVRWILRSVARDKHEEARRDAIEDGLRGRIRELELTAASLIQVADTERALRARAEQSDQLKGLALAEAAHELRGPLGTIAGWLKMLNESAVDRSAHQRALASMTRAARGMVRIIEDLLDHSRAENNQLVLKLATLNLIRVLVEVIEDLRPLAQLKKIRITFSAQLYKIEVQGDAWRLQQVFRNIIGNAIKFTPEHGAIHVAASTEEMQAKVLVTDTGRGIPAESLARIFAPFAQLGAPGTRHTGLGLGLSIARRLVELHGGSVCAESKGQDSGSTFTVWLPPFAPN